MRKTVRKTNGIISEFKDKNMYKNGFLSMLNTTLRRAALRRAMETDYRQQMQVKPCSLSKKNLKKRNAGMTSAKRGKGGVSSRLV
jgi:hypothetical protein